MRFVLFSEGQSAPLASQVTPAWLAQVAMACEVQLNRDVAPYWGGQYAIRAGAGPADVLPTEIAFAMLDALPGESGAIAYHDVEGGAVPFALLGLSSCSTLDEVAEAIAHECIETAGDAGCNVWAEAEDGFEYARELCDAVESNSYVVSSAAGGPEVRLSDFVLPAFFQRGAPGPYCYTQAIGVSAAYPIAPFVTASGGYQIRRTVGTGEGQVWGSMRPQRAARATHWSSRVYRRGVRV